MRKATAERSFEVYCNRCRVSFAVGPKRCVHCGGHLDRERISGGDHDFGLSLPMESEQAVLEDEMPTRGGFSPLTLVWVGLLLVGYLYRACTT